MFGKMFVQYMYNLFFHANTKYNTLYALRINILQQNMITGTFMLAIYLSMRRIMQSHFVASSRSLLYISMNVFLSGSLFWNEMQQN